MSDKRKIIIVTGKAQSGKDTTIDFLGPLLDRARIFSFANPLKKFLEEAFGINPRNLWGTNDQKNEFIHIRWEDVPENKGRSGQMTCREFMQYFGTDICRRMYPDCWASATLKNIVNSDAKYAFISDGRFPNEIDHFYNLDRNEFDVIVIRLNRNILNQTHISETALDDYDFAKWANFILIENQNMTLEEKNKYLKEVVLERIINV